jgi:hypothetical protein
MNPWPPFSLTKPNMPPMTCRAFPLLEFVGPKEIGPRLANLA